MTLGTYQALVGYPRFTPLATWDPTYGAYVSPYLASNLGFTPLSCVCRSSSLATTATRYLATLDKQRPIDLVTLCRHGVSLAGTVRIRSYGNPPMVFTVSGGVVSCPGHGLTTGAPITFAAATTPPGSLPAPLVDGTVYYAGVTSLNAFGVYPTAAAAVAGTGLITLTSAGSGTFKLLGNLLYDSGWSNLWPQVFSDSQVQWEDDNWWTLTYTQEQITGYPWTRPFVLPLFYMTYAVTIEISDPNNANGYVDMGMIDLARSCQLTYNYQPGAQYGWRARTRTTETEGGLIDFERLPKPRTFSGSVPYAIHDEAMEMWFEMQRIYDVDTPYLWMEEPQNPVHWLRNAFIARNSQLGNFTRASNWFLDSIPLNIEEVL